MADRINMISFVQIPVEARSVGKRRGSGTRRQSAGVSPMRRSVALPQQRMGLAGQVRSTGYLLTCSIDRRPARCEVPGTVPQQLGFCEPVDLHEMLNRRNPDKPAFGPLGRIRVGIGHIASCARDRVVQESSASSAIDGGTPSLAQGKQTGVGKQGSRRDEVCLGKTSWITSRQKDRQVHGRWGSPEITARRADDSCCDASACAGAMAWICTNMSG